MRVLKSLRGIELLRRLSAQASTSGNALAEELGVTRAAIWQQVERLRLMGVEVLADEEGYRLKYPFTPLVAESIEAAAGPSVRVSLVESTDSTNDDMLGWLSAGESVHHRLLIAEFQRHGRGRRGGNWLAAPGSAISMSFGVGFLQTPPDLACVGLVGALAVRRAVIAVTGRTPQVKWPNDLMLNGAKLGGILTEMRGELNGACVLVIGIGINCLPLPDAEVRLGRAVASLADAEPEHGRSVRDIPKRQPIDRNLLAGTIARTLAEMLAGLTADGFGSFLTEWRRADALRGQSVRVTTEPPLTNSGLSGPSGFEVADQNKSPAIATEPDFSKHGDPRENRSDKVPCARWPDGKGVRMPGGGVQGEVLGVAADGGLRLLTEEGPRTLYSGHVVLLESG